MTAELSTFQRWRRRTGSGPAAVALASGLAALLAGCAGPPARDGANATPASATDTRPAAATRAPEPAAAPAEPTPAALSPQDAQRALSNALDQLQAGQEDAAETELKRVLQTDPNNRLAQSLLRQIREDPQTLLGRESFAYRVLPGESLSRIAQRFMGDVHMFYALARYNNIRVPKTLAGGQIIRVPGKQPAVMTPPPPPSEKSGGVDKPPIIPSPSPSPSPSTSPPPESAERVAERERKAKVADLTRRAKQAYVKQDLDGSQRNWDAVLEIEPENKTALLERQKVLELKEKLRKVK